MTDIVPRRCETCINAKILGNELYCSRDIGEQYDRILVRVDKTHNCDRWESRQDRKD